MESVDLGKGSNFLEAKTFATECGESIRLWPECSDKHGVIGAHTSQAGAPVAVLFGSEVFKKDSSVRLKAERPFGRSSFKLLRIGS
jgi:hypothetical protein